MSDLRCNSCGAARDIVDNFCRRCGRQITVTLPAVRESSVPTLPAELRALPASLPASLLGSVAVLALGAGLELAARRVAGEAARGAMRGVGRALLNRASPRQAANDQGVILDEVLYIRQVRFRR